MEVNAFIKQSESDDEKELEKLSLQERYELKFNWLVSNILSYYKEEVMSVHGISSDEEYDRRTLEGDESIYLSQPNRKFEPTSWDIRVAHVLGLD